MFDARQTALDGYVLFCAGFGSIKGSMAFPYLFMGFFSPFMYLSGIAMCALGFLLLMRKSDALA